MKDFMCSNGTLGPHSIEVLSELMFEIENFSLNNLQGTNAKQIRDLLQIIIEKGQKIKKLRISNMNLNDGKIIDLLT